MWNIVNSTAMAFMVTVTTPTLVIILLMYGIWNYYIVHQELT